MQLLASRNSASEYRRSQCTVTSWLTERREGDLFKGLSFDTISSTGPNGAIIHYKPSATDSHIIDKDAIYLCDSGGETCHKATIRRTVLTLML